MAGLLASAMSGAESLRRNLLDFVKDPIARIERSVGQTQDYQRELGDLYRQGYDAEGNVINPDAANAFNTAMANMASNMSNVAGATVYHGSPAKFERFDPTKIGSGEGAQAYGYGHYVAESPEVAKGYQQAVSRDKFLTPSGFFNPSELEHLNVKAEMRKGDINKAIELAKKYSQPDSDYPEVAAKAARDLAKLEKINASGGVTANPGSFYKIDLPDDQIAKMLDWDKPISKQSPEIQALAKQHGLAMDDLGGDLVAAMDAKRAAGAEAMRQAGIPGIKYFDAQSRPSQNVITSRLLRLQEKFGGDAEKAVDEFMRSVHNTDKVKAEMRKDFLKQLQQARTSNFVVFPGNEGLLNILERNSQPLKNLLESQ